jgi:4-hydroxy-4-methyl-2-oxoglutarate aldolase
VSAVLAPELQLRLGALTTAGVSDALDHLGIVGQCLGIAPQDRSFHLCGPAFTVRYAPLGVDGGTVGDYIDDVAPGSVVTLDNLGRMDATVWGDILTGVAHRRGVGGTAIDGVCRDIRASLDVGYPIFARGTWMRTGKDRVRVDAINEAVSLGGVRVRAGDVLLGDADGLLVVPADRVEQVVETAARIEQTESQIRLAVAAGTTLREARLAFGYHSLQTRS